MALTIEQLKGLLPAMPTPVDADANVDVRTAAKLVEFLLAAGMTGLVPVGGTGEYAALSPRDRQLMVEVTVKTAAGRVPVVAGVLSTGFKDAVQAGKDFKAAGADGLMLLTPFYVTATPDGMREYFRAFRDAVDLPVLLYEIPSRTGIALRAETIAGMVEDGSIVGMKACNTDLGQFARVVGLVGGRIAVLSGEEPYFATHVAMGARGGVLATANLFPKAWLEIYELASRGDLPAALARQQRLWPLLDAAFAETNPGPLKEAMAMLGMPVGPVLRPLQRPHPDTIAKLSAALESLRGT